ncbi:MAG TPA: type II toxin-antitoxin system RelE/ParE family toxin [Crinalium sp.]|jgi:addiction module RelE/StbE family toxin
MKLVWTKQAIVDLNAAYDYIAETSPDVAEVIIERIENSLESLRQFPEMGRPGRVKDTREVVVPRTPFILPYRVRKNRIEILAVLHGSRRWPDNF